ncbi:hypothetical protein A2311_05670 [candidate division WOR-1 bacterium RIFOXYB2_FULL_48_7]|uniref:Nucleoid-associated protein, YbaB/EbfC family n=1 Tax=candidate division WOR-1 bacterium RIFOXYB2_FULL_48_7 TaxID=1802583 RepID=A0A1F4TMN9_UNCSA|nr:MAG: hypothetical protein A2311_05670 [candidate division WOR-1 bacterium RIFOXYB2_FULL_48_7]
MIFGNIGKMGEMLKQAKLIKDAMCKIKCEGEAHGLKVFVNGEMDIIDVQIPANAEASKLAGNFREAANKALHKAKQEAAKLMQGMGGLGLPGM